MMGPYWRQCRIHPGVNVSWISINKSMTQSVQTQYYWNYGTLCRNTWGHTRYQLTQMARMQYSLLSLVTQTSVIVTIKQLCCATFTQPCNRTVPHLDFGTLPYFSASSASVMTPCFTFSDIFSTGWCHKAIQTSLCVGYQDGPHYLRPAGHSGQDWKGAGKVSTSAENGLPAHWRQGWYEPCFMVIIGRVSFTCQFVTEWCTLLVVLSYRTWKYCIFLGK